MPEDKQSWWSTLPGVITAVATLITAIGGLIIIMRSADHSSQQQMRQPTSDDLIQQPISQPTTDRSVQQQTTKPMSRRTTTASYATVIASDFLALKVAPDITSKRILKIDPNEVVQILLKTATCETIGGIYDCWYKIIYKGAEGYAFGGYLQLQN